MNKIEIPDVALWEGQTKNELAHGVGRATGDFGIYEGEYNQGYPHGFGRMIFRSKDVYEG